MSRALAQILANDRIITAAQFTEAAEASKSGKSHIRYLIEKKAIDEVRLLHYLSQKFGLPSINLAKFEVSNDVLKMVPSDASF